MSKSEPDWTLGRKPRRSVNDGACVEVAPFDSRLAIRDSKDPDGPVIVCSPAQWQTLLDGAKSGRYDRL